MTTMAHETRSLVVSQNIEQTALAQRDVPSSPYKLTGRSAQRAPDMPLR